MTLAGIEPATFRFVTQHLNHCATAEDVFIYLFYVILFRWREIFRTRPDLLSGPPSLLNNEYRLCFPG